MKGEVYFVIPEDALEYKALIVEGIPQNWSWVDGRLYAPKTLIESGTVAQNTSFVLSRFHSIKPTIDRGYLELEKNNGILGPDLYAIMVERKLPRIIVLDEAGYEGDIVTLELTKRIVASFLRKGYIGSTSFFKGCHRNNKYDNPARCGIQFQGWFGPRILDNESGSQPARVKIEWDDAYDGKEEDIKPIIDFCRTLKLREYTPVSSLK